MIYDRIPDPLTNLIWGAMTFAPSMFGARVGVVVLWTRISVAVFPLLGDSHNGCGELRTKSCQLRLHWIDPPETESTVCQIGSFMWSLAHALKLHTKVDLCDGSAKLKPTLMHFCVMQWGQGAQDHQLLNSHQFQKLLRSKDTIQIIERMLCYYITHTF